MDHVILEEDMTTSEHVQKFSIYIYPNMSGKRILVYQGTTIGHKFICPLPIIRTWKIEVVIEKENEPHTLKNIRIIGRR